MQSRINTAARMRSPAARPEGVATRVEQSLAALKQEVARVVRQDDFDCPRPPEVAMQVLRLANQREADLDEVVRLVRTDPFLAGQVLGLASSAAHARGVEIETIEQAVAQVGARATRDLVFAVSVRGKVFRQADQASLARDFWAHAYGCGRVAEFIAEWSGFQVGYAFLGGLLHDIGKPVVLSVIGDLTRQGVRLALPGLDTVDEVIQALHVEVGALTGRRWGLPREVLAAIRWHHYLDGVTEHSELPALICAANAVCHHLGIGCATEPIDFARTQVFQKLGLGPELAAEMCRDVAHRTLDHDFLLA